MTEFRGDIQAFTAQLEGWGEEEVRRRFTAQEFGAEGAAARSVVEDWLRERSLSRSSKREEAILEETRRSNSLALEANAIARDSNLLASSANRLAESANFRSSIANFIAVMALIIAIIAMLMAK